jgi:hypothetical protein
MTRIKAQLSTAACAEPVLYRKQTKALIDSIHKEFGPWPNCSGTDYSGSRRPH